MAESVERVQPLAGRLAAAGMLLLRRNLCVSFWLRTKQGLFRSGAYWTLHRYFSPRNPDAPMSVGFLAQAPTGETCTAVFEQITLCEKTLTDPRDGS